ncbi:MAG TPA: DUF4153 domain-containing protein [Syntrophomonadaceae bacterium]|nr:DUF4153 domain-containing protein [Syntrophomonadaceae bacterium]
MKRFPITLLFSTAVAVMLITISELQPINNRDLQETLIRITMIFALGIPISLCLKLWWERKESRTVLESTGFIMAGGLILILYYFFLLNELSMVSITRYIGVNLAFYLGFLFIPYLPSKDHFEMYIIKLGTGLIITVVYTAVLFMGLAAILFTLDALLGVAVPEKLYSYTGIILGCVFAPAYFLAGIPLKDHSLKDENYLTVLKVLLLYIVIPLLTAYTAILYIYFIKIIVSWEWPSGLVSHLVLWYALIVTAVLFLITPLRDENKLANIFSKWMPISILPLLIMMFISMGIRINAYGVTENRYYVVVMGLWVFGIMVYYSLMNKPLNIVLPVSLAIFALISVLGPLSSYSISTFSQNNRLEAILLKNNMLVDGKIQAAPADISKEDRIEISGILAYFNSKHSLNYVKYLPEGFEMDDMDEVFGFPYEEPDLASPEDYFFFARNETEAGAVDIKEYDYMFDTGILYYDRTADQALKADFNEESGILRISQQGALLYEKDLNSFIKDLLEKHGGQKDNLPTEEMTLIDENEKIKVKISFKTIHGSRDAATGNTILRGFEGYLFVKIK